MLTIAVNPMQAQDTHSVTVEALSEVQGDPQGRDLPSPVTRYVQCNLINTVLFLPKQALNERRVMGRRGGAGAVDRGGNEGCDARDDRDTASLSSDSCHKNVLDSISIGRVIDTTHLARLIRGSGGLR